MYVIIETNYKTRLSTVLSSYLEVAEANLGFTSTIAKLIASGHLVAIAAEGIAVASKASIGWITSGQETACIIQMLYFNEPVRESEELPELA